MQTGIQSTPRQQFRMGSLLDHASGLHGHDDVGPLDRGQPVRDAEGGAADHERFEGGLNGSLRLSIEGAGRLIEDEDGRVA